MCPRQPVKKQLESSGMRRKASVFIGKQKDVGETDIF
jgi:hypothetical protein